MHPNRYRVFMNLGRNRRNLVLQQKDVKPSRKTPGEARLLSQEPWRFNQRQRDMPSFSQKACQYVQEGYDGEGPDRGQRPGVPGMNS
jgi:hypothetical protein